MAGGNNSSVSSKLLDAIRDNHMKSWKSLILENPKILDVDVWPEKPLGLAWKLRRFNFISEIGNIKPELVCEKIEDGKTILHLASISGDDEMVRALVGLRFEKLYFEKDDESSMIPLQMAILHGRVDVVRLLLSACPDSIEEVTPEKKTVFHLAAESFRPADTFKVLLEEAKELNKEYLLQKKDCQGDTLLHIAVTHKQLQIVKMCIPHQSYGFASWVKAKNSNDETALDLCRKISDPDIETRQIGQILQRACRPDQAQFHDHIETSAMPPERTLETTNVLLVVLALFIGIAFAVTCALPTFFPSENLDLVTIAVVVFELQDVMYGRVPLIFYIMCFITVVLTTSTSILSMLLYSLPCGSLMLLGGFATFILYLLLAHYVMPKFYVRAGSHRFPSYYFMLILVLGFIAIGAIMIHLGNSLILHLYNLVKWLMKKVVSIFRSPSNETLPLRNSFEVQMVGAASCMNQLQEC